MVRWTILYIPEFLQLLKVFVICRQGSDMRKGHELTSANPNNNTFILPVC